MTGLPPFAIASAPQIANFGRPWSYLQQAFAIFVPAVAAILPMGALRKQGGGCAFRARVIGNAHGPAGVLSGASVAAMVLAPVGFR